MDEQIVHANHSDFADLSGEQAVRYLKSSSSATREFRVPAVGTVTGSQTPPKLSFNVKLNPNEAVDRCVCVEYTVSVTITGAADDKSLVKTNGLVLAAYPLNRISSDLNVKINNNSKSVNPSEYVAAFANTHDSAEYRRMCSFPAQPDNYNTVSAMALRSGVRYNTGTGAIDNAALSASINEAAQTDSESPFCQEGASYAPTRGQFPPSKVTVVAKGAGVKNSVTYEFTCLEPLLHPIFRTSEYKSVLARVSSLDVDIQLSNLLGMFIQSNDLLKSEDTGALTQAVTSGFTFVTAPTLVYRTYAPTVAIPPVLSFNFFDHSIIRESITTADFAEQVFASRTYTWSQVPHRIMIFAKPRGTPVDSARADGFLAINGLTFRTSADSGGLSGSSRALLYQMSTRNGLNMSFDKFTRNLGSVVILDLERGDLAGYLPGVRMDFNFDLSVTVQNTQFTKRATINSPIFIADTPSGTVPVNQNYDLFVIGYMESKLVCDGAMSSIINGDNQDLVKTILSDRPVQLVPDDVSNSLVRGGSFLSGVGKFFNSVMKNIVPVISVIKDVKGLLGRGQDTGGLYLGSGKGGTVHTGGMLRTLG
jgi:hypothetical protein